MTRKRRWRMKPMGLKHNTWGDLPFSGAARQRAKRETKKEVEEMYIVDKEIMEVITRQENKPHGYFSPTRLLNSKEIKETIEEVVRKHNFEKVNFMRLHCD